MPNNLFLQFLNYKINQLVFLTTYNLNISGISFTFSQTQKHITYMMSLKKKIDNKFSQKYPS